MSGREANKTGRIRVGGTTPQSSLIGPFYEQTGAIRVGAGTSHATLVGPFYEQTRCIRVCSTCWYDDFIRTKGDGGWGNPDNFPSTGTGAVVVGMPDVIFGRWMFGTYGPYTYTHYTSGVEDSTTTVTVDERDWVFSTVSDGLGWLAGDDDGGAYLELPEDYTGWWRPLDVAPIEAPSEGVNFKETFSFPIEVLWHGLTIPASSTTGPWTNQWGGPSYYGYGNSKALLSVGTAFIKGNTYDPLWVRYEWVEDTTPIPTISIGSDYSVGIATAELSGTTPGDPLDVRMYIDASVFRVRVWPTGAEEPTGWTAECAVSGLADLSLRAISLRCETTAETAHTWVAEPWTSRQTYYGNTTLDQVSILTGYNG